MTAVNRPGVDGHGHQAERVVVILNRYGLHARPAAEFVKLSSRFASKVTVEKDGLEVNGKSIMGVMMLAAECGSELTIRTTGEDADEALEALSRLVSNRFGETDADYEIGN
ncbi:MAG: HPr family phosphocarrier protein [Gemmatimonadetes bacterium]|nr:HPr family phosphocarrier protein [Gemmatimonadota bacterium]